MLSVPNYGDWFCVRRQRLDEKWECRSLACQSVAEPAALLFVGDHDVEHVVSLSVLALKGGSACFSVFGDFRSDGHHHFMASARQGFFWWEIDITYYTLKIMSWLGIVWDLRKVPTHLLTQQTIAA